MKARFLALMALVLGMVSCQNDFDEANNLGKGEVDFTLNVAVPEMTTRAAGAGSEKSGLENVDLSKYDIRYILEVYDKNGDLAKERMTNYTDEDQTAFNLRLVPGRQYTFVVWADFVDQIAGDRVEGKNYDKHYITADGLKKVTVNEASWTAIDESRDAYTGKHTETEFKGTSNITVELKRPFAKLRVVTTDIKELYGDLMPKTVKVNYISTYFYNEFNALTQDVNNSTVSPVAAPEMTVDLTKMTYTNEAPKSNGKMTLFADYFFRATDDRVMFTMDIVDSNDEAIPQVVFNTNIPVERNYLTTVLGPILTDSNNINVTINDAFTNGTEWNPDSDDYDVEMISGTKTETMILESGTYLFDDVIIKAAGDAIVVKGDVVIDVMGSLTLDSKGGIVVENGGSLVINGVVETRAAERAGRLVVETEEGSAIAGQNITIQNLAGLTAKANGKHAFGIGAAEAEVTIVNTKIDYVCGGYVQPLFVNDAKYGKSEPEGGAAIGGAKVTIIDSEIVKAEGGSKAAAIGNKFWAGTEIVIKNSTLGDIFGGNASAAIGGSRYDGENKHNISIEIENSTITNAVGGQAGAGIGSGYDTHCNQQNYEATNNIVIKNSTIKAKGGKNAAGIGTGYHSAYLTGSIDAASTIEATRGDEPFYKNTYTVSQNIGYGIVDPAREFSGANAEVTFTVAGKVIATPAIEVNDAASLAAALMADRKNISVVLTADIELPISSLGQITGGSGEYKLGAENTETITIDLGGKKLNITTTYWSNLGAKNNDALFTIKNGTMTSSQASGTWNSYDLTFSNCDYVFEDVEFAKAVAFDNAGKNVTMNNVTINETHDYYAMWITATGQTVNIDGLTVESAGRGIKIDEQYVGDSVAKVTLNVKNAKFTTAKKAAIMVKSAAGADIALENVNIENVAADTVNAVWVDSDAKQHAAKVDVTGGSMVVEGVAPIEGETTEDVQAALNSAVSIENAVAQLPAGEYTFPKNFAKGVTVICEEGTVFKGYSSLNANGATVMGATFKNQSGSAVGGTVNGTYKNCVFDGSNALRDCYAGETVVFENCVFTGDVYGVHFDAGSNDAIFRNCTFSGFNAFGAALTELTLEDCTFVANGRSGYNGINMWGSTNLIRCEFTFDGSVTEWVDVCYSNKSFNIEDCTINGQPFVIGDLGIFGDCDVKLDGEHYGFASSNDGLKYTLDKGASIINLYKDGEYSMPGVAKGKTFAINGKGENTIIKVAQPAGGEMLDGNIDGSTVTFNKVRIVTGNKGAGYNNGFTRPASVTYNECVIDGMYSTINNHHTFNKCTFNQTGDLYNVWTWGAKTATFTECTFNCDGKAMLLYGYGPTVLTMTDCVFNDNGGLVDELKAAIEIGNDFGATYELVVNNATVNGFAINPKGTPTNTTLWANKNSMTQDKLNVVVDGVDVF